MKKVRLLPLVAFAALCLFTLKVAGLFLSGGYMLSGSVPASAQTAQKENASPAAPDALSKAQEQAGAAEPNSPSAAEKTADSKPGPDGAASPQETEVAQAGPAAGPQAAPSSSELAVLQSLVNRRKALEQRERELRLRENLLKAAEQRVEKQIAQLKSIEARIQKEVKKQDKEKDAQYARLVKMYSGMKPKKAAKIFNRLDLEVLKGLVKRMKPRAMSEILAAMDTAAAQRLTLELANDSQAENAVDNSLPKIQGGS